MKPEEALSEQTRCDRSATHHFVADSRPSCSERIDSLARQLTEAERENGRLTEYLDAAHGTRDHERKRAHRWQERALRYREALEQVAPSLAKLLAQATDSPSPPINGFNDTTNEPASPSATGSEGET